MMKWVKRIIIGLLVVLILLAIVLFFIAGTFFDVVRNPERIKNDKEIEAQFKARINDKYGIALGTNTKTEHFSYYTIFEEFGYDLILSAKKEDFKLYIPKGSSIEVITPESLGSDFHAKFLCDGEELEIESQEIRKQVCGLVSRPYPLPVATHRVRSDWVVFVVFFSEKNLVWIKETEW
jgi:hypothetical protein